MDSRCIVAENGFPIIFINNAVLGGRRRFSLAYELGHLVMHCGTLTDSHRDTNHEANPFSAELLMPEQEFRKDFEQDITVGLLGILKQNGSVHDFTALPCR